MFLRRHLRRSLGAWRRKLIRETEAALLAGILHPEGSPRIPTILVGAGRFDRQWSQRWWTAVLDLDANAPAADGATVCRQGWREAKPLESGI